VKCIVLAYVSVDESIRQVDKEKVLVRTDHLIRLRVLKGVYVIGEVRIDKIGVVVICILPELRMI